MVQGKIHPRLFLDFFLKFSYQPKSSLEHQWKAIYISMERKVFPLAALGFVIFMFEKFSFPENLKTMRQLASLTFAKVKKQSKVKGCSHIVPAANFHHQSLSATASPLFHYAQLWAHSTRQFLT